MPTSTSPHFSLVLGDPSPLVHRAVQEVWERFGGTGSSLFWAQTLEQLEKLELSEERLFLLNPGLFEESRLTSQEALKPRVWLVRKQSPPSVIAALQGESILIKPFTEEQLLQVFQAHRKSFSPQETASNVSGDQMREAVRDYCREHFRSVAREVILEELERLTRTA